MITAILAPAAADTPTINRPSNPALAAPVGLAAEAAVTTITSLTGAASEVALQLLAEFPSPYNQVRSFFEERI